MENLGEIEDVRERDRENRNRRYNIFISLFIVFNMFLSSILIAKTIETQNLYKLLDVKPIIEHLENLRTSEQSVFHSNLRMIQCLERHIISCDPQPIDFNTSLELFPNFNIEFNNSF